MSALDLTRDWLALPDIGCGDRGKELTDHRRFTQSTDGMDIVRPPNMSLSN